MKKMVEVWKALTFWNKIKFLFSLLVGVVVVVFATLNAKSVEVDLLTVKWKLPLAFVMLVFALAGYIFSYAMSYRSNRNKDRLIQQLETENNKLKLQEKPTFESHVKNDKTD